MTSPRLTNLNVIVLTILPAILLMSVACGEETQPRPTPINAAALIEQAIQAQPPGVTPADVAKAVQDAMAQQPGVSEQQVASAIASALSDRPGVTQAQVASAIASALSDRPGVTQAQVASAIASALSERPGVTQAQVASAIGSALSERPGATQEEVQAAIETALAQVVPATAPPSAPQNIGGTVVMATEHPQATVPLIATNIVEEYTNSLIYNGLTRPDPITLAATPELAESWDVSDGGLTWTFNLRPGVTWSDGQPLSSGDVKFSWEFYCHPDIPGNENACSQGFNLIEGAADYITGNASGISGIESMNESTVRIKMTDVYAPFLSLTTQNYILPKHALESIPAADLGGHDFALGKGTIGTGPFVMETWTQNEKLIVRAREDYWEGRPSLDSFVISWCLGDQRSAAFTQMKVGQINLMAFFCNMPHDFVPQAESDPSIDFLAFRGTNVFVVEYNLNTPPFDSKDVRYALSYATDRDAIGEGLYSGRWISHPHVTPPAFTDFYDPDVSVPNADSVKLAESLGNAGYTIGSDGLFKDGDGNTLNFELSHYPSAFQFGPALHAQWKDAGIDVEVQGYEWAAFFFPIYLEGSHGALAQGNEAGFNFHPIVPWLDLLSVSGINGWPNAQDYQTLIETANGTLDPAIQAQSYKALQSMMAEDQYVLFTGWPDDLWGHSADLELPRAANGKAMMRYVKDFFYR
jgi:peptide/nickel transport system substrate-binding protein